MADQSPARGPMTDEEILTISRREYANGVYAESTLAFARALLAEAGDRVIAALVEEVPCNRNERDGLIRRILGVREERDGK